MNALDRVNTAYAAASTRGASSGAGVHNRVISEFAIIDGVAVDGSGESGNRYRGAMAIPGAWRAAVMLADLLGRAPWDAWRTIAGQLEQIITPKPLLLEQPNPPDAAVTSFSSWGLDLIWHGNAVGIYTARNANGWPTAAVGVPAEQVGVRRITEYGMSSVLPIGSLEYQIGTMRLGPEDVLHIKGPCQPGAVRGMGVLEAHLDDTLAVAREQIRQAKSLSNHGVPTGYLKTANPDETPEKLRKVKAAWLESQRDRTIAALGPTTEFVPLSWNPEQLQMVEARQYTLTELELIFGLPVGWLGGMRSARQYSNIEQDAVNLLKFSAGGHLERFEQALSLAMPRGTRARADLDFLLRADTLTRYQAHAIGISSGFLVDDEARLIERRPPLTAEQRARARPPAPQLPPAPPADDNPTRTEDDKS